MQKSLPQYIWDLIGVPFRFALLPQDLLPRFGWTALEDERLLTMIDPILGGIGHAIWRHGEFHQRGGMKEGERGGLWTAQIVELCQDAGFVLHQHRRLLFGLNHFCWFQENGHRGELG